MFKSTSRFPKVLALCLSAGAFSSIGHAQTVAVVQTNSPTAPGANAIIEVRFTSVADTGPTARAAFQVDFNIARPPVAASNVTVANGIVTGGAPVCIAPSPANSGVSYIGGGADGVPPINAIGTIGVAEVACTFTVPISAAATAGATNIPLVINQTDLSGNETTTAGTLVLTISGGGANTPPALGYSPTTGTTIAYPAGGAGPTVTVSNAGGGAGSGAAATTTLTNCVISGGGGAFTTTNFNPAITAIGAGAPSPTSFTLPNCTPQAALTNATLTCVETRGGVAFAPAPTWPLTCPAAAVGATPPTLTYIPAPSVSGAPPGGPFTSIAYGASGNISVLCASPSPDGTACGGTGTGDPATARLQTIGVTYIGPNFSPIPTNLSCVFANQSNATVASPLNFVAQTADPGNIRCTCANVPTFGDNYRVSVQEISPVGGTTTTRNFDITCGGITACGTLNLTPGTLTLTPNAAAANIIGVSLTGASANVSRTVACTTSAAPAGSTFTLTTNPTPLTVSTSPNVTGNVLAACTNTATTAATVTVTCSNTSNTANCATTPSTFQLTCPGQGTPPPTTEQIPVPTLNEQGRILLAALVLLLGLGFVGFRMRG